MSGHAAIACPIDGCKGKRGRAQVMCRSCWAKVPGDLQRAVWRAYRARSQQGGMARHWQAVEDAHAAVEGREPEELFA